MTDYNDPVRIVSKQELISSSFAGQNSPNRNPSDPPVNVAHRPAAPCELIDVL
jgi:hypothetical protein